MRYSEIEAATVSYLVAPNDIFSELIESCAAEKNGSFLHNL